MLLEAEDCLIPNLPEKLRTYALARLRKMGVEVHFQKKVSHITHNAVHLKDDEVVPTETVIWTAGVTGDPRAKIWGLPTDRSGRVSVLPTLEVSGYPNVYVIGDLASVEGYPLPMIAPVAIQQGVTAAKNILMPGIAERIAFVTLEPSPSCAFSKSNLAAFALAIEILYGTAIDTMSLANFTSAFEPCLSVSVIISAGIRPEDP